jgi:hypothetical protein
LDNPGLKLANAFGVSVHRFLMQENADYRKALPVLKRALSSTE